MHMNATIYADDIILYIAIGMLPLVCELHFIYNDTYRLWCFHFTAGEKNFAMFCLQW